LLFPSTPVRRAAHLQVMRELCLLFDNPQKSYECWHVAGSKGKGSVSAMIAAILAGAGESVGVYQSPHVSDWRERIRTSAGFFTDELYLQAMQELYSRRGEIQSLCQQIGMAVGWFELVTLLGMLTFRNAGVRRAVFEVGMGGRLDATNIIQPVISVITPIEREHTQYLGPDLQAIAREKCGIIKEKVPVVTSRQDASVQAVIVKTARERQCRLTDVPTMMEVGVKQLTQTGMDIELEDKKTGEIITAQLPLLGEIQAENAALATLAVRTIFPAFPATIISQGLSQVRLPGRFQIIDKIPDFPGIPALVLDGAHTPRSLELTLATWRRLFGPVGQGRGESSGKWGRVLFACAADKEMKQLAQIITANFAEIILTKPGEFKKSDLPGLAQAFAEQGAKVACIGETDLAIRQAFFEASSAGEPLLVTGSFYLLGEVLQFLSKFAIL